MQGDELIHSKLFGSQPCLGKGIDHFAVIRAQIVSQRFPLLSKRAADKYQKLSQIAWNFRFPLEANGRGIDFRRRSERGSRHLTDKFDIADKL